MRLLWNHVLPVSLMFGFAAQVAASTDPGLVPISFERHEVALGEPARLTVLTGSFAGGGEPELADLAVVNLDTRGERRLRIYRLDAEGSWSAAVDTNLHRRVRFVDVAAAGDRDRLITYGAGRFAWFDPESGAERPLLELAIGFKPSEGYEIPWVDVTRDLNADGRDDLVVPAFDGFWIALQADDGSFETPVKLGPPEPFLDQRAFDDDDSYRQAGISAMTIPWYLSRVHQMDFDRDGRRDLVFWNRDHFDVHLQDEVGGFEPIPVSFTTDAKFDSDGAYSFIFSFEGARAVSLLLGTRPKTTHTVLQSILDVDGDGVADLVTHSLTGRSILRQRSVYSVHFGHATDGGTSFESDAGTAIRPPRKGPGGLQASGYSSQAVQDFDGDGRSDVMLWHVKMGAVGMFRAMVGNSVAINLEIYRAGTTGNPAEPTTTRRIRRFAPFAGIGNVFFPNVLVGDVDGDGRSDLLVGKSPKELRIFRGVPGPELLARKPEKVAVDLPYNERDVRLVDLNRDGKQDVVSLVGPTTRVPDRPPRVTLLIAR